MSNRYAIHLETPAGLQFDGMVEADSLYEAAMKWARDIGYEAGKARSGIAVQDPNYNEEGKLRFSALSAGDISDVYGATECIYVASEFDPKALFREMAVHYEKPAEKREEFTVQDLKDAVSKLKAHAIKPDKDGYYRWRVDAAGNIELVSGLEEQDPAKDNEVDTWTGMRVFELLNIPGLTCHEGIWQALSDEQRARCESIARAINRNSAPRSGLLTGELLYKSLQRANDDLEIKIKDPLCAWEMLTPPPRKYYENAASLLSKELSSDRKNEPIDDLATRQAMREKVERDSVMVRNFKEALSALKDRRDFLSEKGFVQFLISNEHAMQIVLEAEKQEPEPIGHDFTAAKEVRPVESTLLRIWLAKDESNLNKQMDGMSGNWPGVGGPYCFDVEIGDGDATIVGGDPDPLYRGEIAAVSKTNKHGAGIRIRRDTQDDYIYIFPSLVAYPKEASDGEEWTVDNLKLAFDDEDILFDIDDEMAGHVVRIVNKRRKAKTEAPKEDADRVRTYSIKKLFQGEPGGAETELALVVAESMESAARKWAKAFSLSPEGKEKTDVVCVARSSAGAPWSHFKITNKSMNDSDIVYFNNELYSISEHRRKSFADDGSVPEEVPQAISYNVQFTAKRDSTPNSEECRKQFEQAVMRACREAADEQP